MLSPYPSSSSSNPERLIVDMENFQISKTPSTLAEEVQRDVAAKVLVDFRAEDRVAEREAALSSGGVPAAAYEKEYAVNQYPTKQRKKELAQETGQSHKQVCVWFQNKRQREKALSAAMQRGVDAEMLLRAPVEVTAVLSAPAPASATEAEAEAEADHADIMAHVIDDAGEARAAEDTRAALEAAKDDAFKRANVVNLAGFKRKYPDVQIGLAQLHKRDLHHTCFQSELFQIIVQRQELADLAPPPPPRSHVPVVQTAAAADSDWNSFLYGPAGAPPAPVVPPVVVAAPPEESSSEEEEVHGSPLQPRPLMPLLQERVQERLMVPVDEPMHEAVDEPVEDDGDGVEEEEEEEEEAMVVLDAEAVDDFWDGVRNYAQDVKKMTADEARAKAARDGLELVTSETASGFKHVRKPDTRSSAKNFPYAVATDLKDDHGATVRFGACFVSAEAAALAIAHYFHLRDGGAVLAAPAQ